MTNVAQPIRKTIEVLKNWGINPIPETPELRHDIVEWGMSWIAQARDGDIDDLLVFEKDNNPGLPHTAIDWILTRAMLQEPRPCYIYCVSGQQIIRFNGDAEAVTEQRQKIQSAPIIWIRELTAAELSNHERQNLYKFLEEMDRKDKTVIITASLPISTIVDWVGPVITRHFERQYALVAV